MTYANPEALVSTDWLTEHLDDPAVRVIEVDEDINLFGEGSTFREQPPGAGPMTCTTPSAATTSTRRARAPFSRPQESALTQRLSYTAETTTGSQPMRTGCSSIGASTQ